MTYNDVISYEKLYVKKLSQKGMNHFQDNSSDSHDKKFIRILQELFFLVKILFLTQNFLLLLGAMTFSRMTP